MCDKYSISLDIKAYYIVMNDLINKRKSDFLLPLQGLILETFFPWCFSLLDTNLRTWHLGHHLYALVRPSCNISVCDRAITGPVPAQVISKNETKWQTLLCFVCPGKPGFSPAGLRHGGNADGEMEWMCRMVGALAVDQLWQWTGWARGGPERCRRCPLSSSLL